MKIAITFATVLSLTAASALPVAAQQITETKTGTTFESKISMPHYEGTSLGCMGVGPRTKFGFKVYGCGLYLDQAGASQALASFKGASVQTLQGSTDFYSAVINAQIAKAIIMKFVRDVGKEKIEESFTEGLEKTLGALDSSPLRAEAQKFLGMFNEDMAVGQVIGVYGKGSAVNVYVNGKEKGTIDNAQLASAIFAIWLGPKPVSDDLKRGLISQSGWALK